MSGELLLEVRVEEIPARMLPGAAKELATRVFEELMARGVPPREVAAGFTPRRLWLTMAGLPAREEDRRVLEVGPPVSASFDPSGNPTAAAIGFARKFDVGVERLERVDFSQDAGLWSAGSGVARPSGGATPKGERVVLHRVVTGRAMVEILGELLPSVLSGIAWAKSMKWGVGVGPWVRPVHGIVALFEGEVVPFSLFGIESGRTTAGHPTLSPAPFEVSGIASWRARLDALGLEPDPAVREQRLRAAMAQRAAAAGGTLVEDGELLAKLAAICEIPGVMEGALDAALMALPREVLITSLRDHQSALTVERDGKLLPIFLTVMDRPDDPAGRVRAGNEWVVAARLADARFFWEKDRAASLASKISALEGLGFHQKLGSYAAKRVRLIALARFVAERLGLPDASQSALAEAASLAKVDLTTDMVREFTTLQGVMGGIYARQEGLPEAVWSAIYDQYAPAGTDDALPRAATGRILSLCDRLDTLVGFFGIGAVPTGSRDPFGLRRAAQGVTRLLFEQDVALDLTVLVREAHRAYEGALVHDAEKTWSLLRPFFEDRLRFLLELDGCAYDEIEAALGADGESLAAFEPIRAKARALHAAREGREFLQVVLAAKRIANIVRDQPAVELDAAALDLPAELALLAADAELARELDTALGRLDFAAGLSAVARLGPVLERFFEEVLVMDPDASKRARRLALLRQIGSRIGRIADLSKLVVDKSDSGAA